jgi:hypothetical protein
VKAVLYNVIATLLPVPKSPVPGLNLIVNCFRSREVRHVIKSSRFAPCFASKNLSWFG